MTPAQYRGALRRLGLSQVRAAAFLGISIRTSHGYANGARIPRALEKLLYLMLRFKLSPEDVP